MAGSKDRKAMQVGKVAAQYEIVSFAIDDWQNEELGQLYDEFMQKQLAESGSIMKHFCFEELLEFDANACVDLLSRLVYAAPTDRQRVLDALRRVGLDKELQSGR